MIRRRGFGLALLAACSVVSVSIAQVAFSSDSADMSPIAVVDNRMASPMKGADPQAALENLAAKIGGFGKVSVTVPPAALGTADGIWADITMATDDVSKTGVGLADLRAQVLMGAFRDSGATASADLVGFTVHVTRPDGTPILRTSPRTGKDFDAGTRIDMVGNVARYQEFATPDDALARSQIVAEVEKRGAHVNGIEMIASLQSVPLVTISVDDASAWQDIRVVDSIFPRGAYEGWIMQVLSADGTTLLVAASSFRLGSSTTFRETPYTGEL